jgi:hypothetical protein
VRTRPGPKIPNILRLTLTDSLEVLQPFLSCSQLLHLLHGQLPLPICHLHSPGIQGTLPDVSSKLTGQDSSTDILKIVLLSCNGSLAAIQV